VKLRTLVLVLAVTALGCSASPSPDDARTPPPGPPEPRAGAIEGHAARFSEELPERAPGSNEEQVGASYILGFLQQGRYPGRLEGVPVADLVRSTNVIATPPRGAEPAFVVAVGYGTPPNEALDAHSIGAFLELARALTVRVPDHAVEFVALGAEFAEVEDGTLGSKAMASLLIEESLEPEIIYLSPELSGDGFYARGPLASDFESDVEASEQPLHPVADAAAGVYRDEGLDVTVVDGHPLEVAETLLEFLSETSG
jgi:hypothetical protein